MYDGTAILEHYRECRAGVRELMDAYASLEARLEANRSAVHDELEAACTELGAAYLGGALTPESMARAEALTGYRGFTKRDPLKAMAHERTILTNTIARIAADPRYLRRRFLVGPVGELTQRLDECRELAAPWEEECDRFESLEGFLELVEQGYDTPAWTLKFWDPIYWKQWRQGDAICEALGLDDFGDDVLPAYRPLVAKRAEWRAQVAAARAAIEEVHALVQEHDAAVARLPRLPDVYLEAAARILGQFLARADAELLSEWAQAEAEPDRAVLVALHRVAGLRAKHGFLDEIIGGVAAQHAELRRRDAKYQRKLTKYQRPKHRYAQHSASAMDQGFLAKLPKYRKKHRKLSKRVVALVAFDDYGAFDLDNDPELWWVAMTGKKPSGFTPSLRRWYDRNPGATPRLRTALEDTAAGAVAQAAAAASVALDLGYVS